MTDKKYTDEEIIKALECHINAEDCVGCEMFGRCDEIILTKLVLDLINRQKAEIERLRAKVETRTQEKLALGGVYTQKLKTAKAEAYKEFAEKLENEINIRTTYSREQDKNVIRIMHNLLKEMVGEEE